MVEGGGHGKMGVEDPPLRGGGVRCGSGGPGEHLSARKPVPWRVGLENSWVMGVTAALSHYSSPPISCVG